jgi:hypothetical protein
MATTGDVGEGRQYTAGQVAPPGRYCRVDVVDGRIVVMETADRLPGSLDGHVAVYAHLEAALPQPAPRPAPTSGAKRLSGAD